MKKTPQKVSKDVNVNAKSVVDRLLGEDNIKQNPTPKKKVSAKKKPQ